MMKQVWLSAYLLAAAGALHAVPVTWYLSQVTLSDGGRAVGSFVYDADSQTFGPINVQTTPGPTTANATGAIAGGNYNEATPLFAAPVSFLSKGNAGTRILTLLTPNTLTNAGGTVQLTTGSLEGFCSTGFSNCNAVLAGTASRSVTGGFLTATAPTAPVTWYVNITFSDGGQAVGTFDFDPTTSTYLNADIVTTPSATQTTATRYRLVRPASPGIPTGGVAFQVAPSSPNGVRTLIIQPAFALANFPAFIPSVGVPANGRLNTPVTVPLSNVTSVEGLCSASVCSATGLRTLVSGNIINARPANFTRVISQVADGGGWQTSVVLTNLTDTPAPYGLTFFQDDGTPFAVGGLGAFSARTIPARGVVFLTSTNPASLTQGWGLVTGGDKISVTTTFTSKAANAGGDQEASVPGDNAGSTSLAVPFDNTNGLVSGFALTNTTNVPVTVLAVGYDSTGRILMTDSALTLPAFGHTAFVMSSRPGYQLLNNQRGLLRIFTINGGQPPYAGVNGLLLKFLPNGAFSTVGVTTQ